MKARCRQNPANGLWYCSRMGVTGEGKSPMEAFKDMEQLYADFITKSNRDKLLCYRSPRA